MKNHFLLLGMAVVLTCFLTLCKAQNNNPSGAGQMSGSQSELLSFEYGGFSDTVYAIVQGNIYEADGKNKLPLENVEIISYRPMPKDTVTFTGKSGHFSTGFCSGTFSILIKKNGYQALKLINYESQPDQISHLEAILRKGTGEVIIDISKKKMNK